jgi:hypothetical protein
MDLRKITIVLVIVLLSPIVSANVAALLSKTVRGFAEVLVTAKWEPLVLSPTIFARIQTWKNVSSIVIWNAARQLREDCQGTVPVTHILVASTLAMMEAIVAQVTLALHPHTTMDRDAKTAIHACLTAMTRVFQPKHRLG